MNKCDVRQRVTIPAALADFIEKIQQRRGMKSRGEALVFIVREARRRDREAAAQRKRYARRKGAEQEAETPAKQ